MKRKSIIFKIFLVILILALSLIIFIWAFWGLFLNKPNPLFAHIHFVISVIILIVVVTTVASHIIRLILKPISALTEAVENAAKGDLDQQLGIHSNDELGVLALSFNRMTMELKKMIDSREQLLSDVSHELRTPITRAWIALEMIPDSTEKKSLAGDLKEMEALITGILESERLKNGNIKANPVPVKVSSLFAKLAKTYRHLPGRLSILPMAHDLVVIADETLIFTVLRNLVDNAVKYSPQGKPVEINIVLAQNNLRIEVEDFGTGIPEDKLPYVFEPFYRADNSRSRKTGGYGLGLHLCKRIMDIHRGEIRLYNKPGGSGLKAVLIFSLDIPVPVIH
jgi:signal transduction histidine kinase